MPGMSYSEGEGGETYNWKQHKLLEELLRIISVEVSKVSWMKGKKGHRKKDISDKSNVVSSCTEKKSYILSLIYFHIMHLTQRRLFSTQVF